jgi:hypothetical protein
MLQDSEQEAYALYGTNVFYCGVCSADRVQQLCKPILSSAKVAFMKGCCAVDVEHRSKWIAGMLVLIRRAALRMNVVVQPHWHAGNVTPLGRLLCKCHYRES